MPGAVLEAAWSTVAAACRGKVVFVDDAAGTLLRLAAPALLRSANAVHSIHDSAAVPLAGAGAGAAVLLASMPVRAVQPYLAALEASATAGVPVIYCHAHFLEGADAAEVAVLQQLTLVKVT